jgi:hypothetical protein
MGCDEKRNAFKILKVASTKNADYTGRRSYLKSDEASNLRHGLDLPNRKGVSFNQRKFVPRNNQSLFGF